MDIEKETKRLYKKIAILEMLKKARSRKYSASGHLSTFRAAKDAFHPIKLFNTEQGLIDRVAHWEAVILRIENYYNKQ